MRLHIREQECEITAVMSMCHHPSRDEACAIRYGWHRDQRQAYTPGTSAPSTKVAHAAHEQGASRRVRFEMSRNHESDAPATCGASHGCTHLFTEHLSCPSRRHSAIEPAIAPIHQAKAVDGCRLSPGASRQALPTSTDVATRYG
jgi:hypothetical protein